MERARSDGQWNGKHLKKGACFSHGSPAHVAGNEQKRKRTEHWHETEKFEHYNLIRKRMVFCVKRGRRSSRKSHRSSVQLDELTCMHNGKIGSTVWQNRLKRKNSGGKRAPLHGHVQRRCIENVGWQTAGQEEVDDVSDVF